MTLLFTLYKSYFPSIIPKAKYWTFLVSISRHKILSQLPNENKKSVVLWVVVVMVCGVCVYAHTHLYGYVKRKEV